MSEFFYEFTDDDTIIQNNIFSQVNRKYLDDDMIENVI